MDGWMDKQTDGWTDGVICCCRSRVSEHKANCLARHSRSMRTMQTFCSRCGRSDMLHEHAASNANIRCASLDNRRPTLVAWGQSSVARERVGRKRSARQTTDKLADRPICRRRSNSIVGRSSVSQTELRPSGRAELLTTSRLRRRPLRCNAADTDDDDDDRGKSRRADISSSGELHPLQPS